MRRATTKLGQRRLRLACVYAVLLLPLVVLHAADALRSDVNSPLEWAPRDDPARECYDAFADQFGSGDVLIISWPECTVEETRLDRLTAALRHHSVFFEDGEWLFDGVTSGRESIREFTQQGLSTVEAVGRLRHAMIGDDDRTTCLVIGFTKPAVQNRAKLVPLIQDAVQHTCGAALSEQHLAGPIMDGLAVDRASAATLQGLAPFSSLIVLVAAVWCLRSWRDGLLVFAVAMYCQVVTLAVISLAGDSVSALLVVLPPLIQVLAIAAGLHLVNYYRDASRHGDPLLAADRAFAMGWLPCLLSAGTTAIGMASLMVSRLTPIRAFGAYSACGVIATAAIVLVAIPGFLRRFGMRLIPTVSRDDRHDQRGWELATNAVAALHGLIVLAFLAVTITASCGLRQLNTSVRIETLFDHNSRLLSDYRWLEQKVGPIVPVEVVLTFDERHADLLTDQLAYVRYFDAQLAAREDIRSTISAATFVPAPALSTQHAVTSRDQVAQPAGR